MALTFESFYRSLDQGERAAYAKRANTSTQYIEIHLLPRRKIPRKSTMQHLASASNGAVSYEDVVNYFLLHDAA